MQYNEVILRLKGLADPANVEGMKRFGINTKGTLGIQVKDLRAIARRIGTDHQIAVKLWASGIHAARILASMVDDPGKVNDRQMDEWVKDIDSWDVCDQCCSNLFGRTKHAYAKTTEWCRSQKEFVRRAGFSMIAVLASHDKSAKDETFIRFFGYIKNASTDERNFVRKAVNWSLRQIGKRNARLNKLAIAAALEIKDIDSDSARWIAGNALAELQSEKTLARLK